MEEHLITLLKEGGSLAVLGVVLWAIAYKALPSFLQALREQRSEFLGALEHTETMHEKTITKITLDHHNAIRSAAESADHRMSVLADRVDAQTELMRQVIRSRSAEVGQRRRRSDVPREVDRKG